MKRYGNLYQKMLTMENLRLAYKKSRKGKTWQVVVKEFDKDIDGNLKAIQDLLINKTFRTAEYRTRMIFEPKKREIFCLPLSPDRIVHHAIMNVLEPIWGGFFIHDSYACIAGRGIHRGSTKTMELVRTNKYCLKCDIAKFFPSIDHDILFDIIKRKIKCKDTLELLKGIIYSVPNGKNTPIGNYTSQWFGNLYMNELDQYVKHELKINNYIRYCDDFLLFSDDKKELNEASAKIKEFITNRLKLRLSKCSLFPVSHGVDFLGYRHFRKYILLRKSTTKRVKGRMKILPILLKKGKISVEHFRSSVASTMGWFKWANSHNLSLKLQLDELVNLCHTNDSTSSQKSLSL